MHTSGHTVKNGSFREEMRENRQYSTREIALGPKFLTCN
jgi:hypothetical protein